MCVTRGGRKQTLITQLYSCLGCLGRKIAEYHENVLQGALIQFGRSGKASLELKKKIVMGQALYINASSRGKLK